MQPNLLRAVGYRRVSSQEQTEGHSLDAQTVHIQNYVQSQGWNLVQIYSDAGVSAKKGSRRPAFEQMLKDAEEGFFEVVVVDKIDRFYRHLGGLLSTLEHLNSYGISFVSVQEKLDFTTPWGKLMLTVLGMLAEIYIDNLRQETKKGHRQRARSGLWNGGIPFGYCNGQCAACTDPNGPGYCPNYGKPNLSDGKRLISHPIESIAVKMAFDWYVTGKHSFRTIAQALSSYKVPLPDGSEVMLRQKGQKGYSPPGPFSKDVVRGILQRYAYTGKIAYVGFDDKGKYRSRKPPVEIFDGLQPPLVSQELFDQVARIRDTVGNNSRFRNNGVSVRCFILTGILKCGYCGARMRGISNVGKYFWYEDGRRLEAVGNCQQKITKAQPLEDQMTGFVRSVVATADETRTIDAIQQQYELAEERYKRAQELYLAGQIKREYYEMEKDRYDELANGLRKEKFHATIALHELMRTELARWDALSLVEKKRLLRLAVEAAWVRGNAIVAVQPTIAFLPLLSGAGVGNCGEGGIRTHGGSRPTTVFETAPIGRSGTSP